jgi:hypothetical protein
MHSTETAFCKRRIYHLGKHKTASGFSWEQKRKRIKMKNLILTAILIASTISVLTGCTANRRARQFGGTQNITLPSKTKFVNLTWKDDDLWILTRPSQEGETPVTYTFQEDSSFGVLEGAVIIKEQ